MQAKDPEADLRPMALLVVLFVGGAFLKPTLRTICYIITGLGNLLFYYQVRAGGSGGVGSPDSCYPRHSTAGDCARRWWGGAGAAGHGVTMAWWHGGMHTARSSTQQGSGCMR